MARAGHGARESVAWYLKALPKAFRNRLVPLAPAVTAFLEPRGAGPRRSSPDAIRAWLERDARRCAAARTRGTGRRCRSTSRVAIVVVDAAGRELATDRDLAVVARAPGRGGEGELRRVGARRTGARASRGGTWATCRRRSRSRAAASGSPRIPALVDDGVERVAHARRYARGRRRVDATRRRAPDPHRAQGRVRPPREGRPGFTQAALALKTAIPTDRLLADVLDAIAERAFLADDPLPRTAKAFDEQVKRARARLPAVADAAFRLLATIAAAHHGARAAAWQRRPPALARLAAELRGPARRAGGPGLLCGDDVGAAPAPAALPRGDRAALGQGPRASRAGGPPRAAGRGVDAALAGASRPRPGVRSARPGARRVPLAPRGAPGVAVRAGAQDPRPGLVQAGRKGLGGARTPPLGTRGIVGTRKPPCYSGLAFAAPVVWRTPTARAATVPGAAAHRTRVSCEAPAAPLDPRLIATTTEAPTRRPPPRELAKILADCRDLAVHRLMLAFSARCSTASAIS